MAGHNKSIFSNFIMGFPDGSNSKEPSYNARDLGSIPESERYPGREGMATHSSIFAWEVPWTEEPDRLQCLGSQRVNHN